MIALSILPPLSPPNSPFDLSKWVLLGLRSKESETGLTASSLIRRAQKTSIYNQLSAY